MKLEIEFIEIPATETQWARNGWKVIYGDKYADCLGYDEMLGLVAAITMPKERPMLRWLRTEEEHQKFNEWLNAPK